MPSHSPGRPFAPLAEHLTSLRRGARLTQRDLAAAASVSRSAVQLAESGTSAPGEAVLDAYLTTCRASEADRATAHLLRRHGRTVQRRRLPGLGAPALALIETRADLSAALAAAYERAGAPPLRTISRLAPGLPPVPPTSAWRMAGRRGLPPTSAQLATFLTACRVGPAEQDLYQEAYRRVTADRRVRQIPSPGNYQPEPPRNPALPPPEEHDQDERRGAVVPSGTRPPEAVPDITFVAFHARNHQQFLRYAQVHMGETDAEAVVDDVFTCLLGIWPEALAQPSPQAIAWELLRRRIHHHRIRQAASPGLVDTAEFGALRHQSRAKLAEAESKLGLYTAILGLPDRQYDVVLLTYLLGLSRSKVAELMGVSEGTVRSHVSTARRLLASKLRWDLVL
ncbi:RNA polymerase sigma factor [Streptomyces roseus]|uniref:RNA polymerase sigma factor n=1 Tax=Streptomyces roseus TaxID=66430 RepID=UPI003695A757